MLGPEWRQWNQWHQCNHGSSDATLCWPLNSTRPVAYNLLEPSSVGTRGSRETRVRSKHISFNRTDKHSRHSLLWNDEVDLVPAEIAVGKCQQKSTVLARSTHSIRNEKRFLVSRVSVDTAQGCHARRRSSFCGKKLALVGRRSVRYRNFAAHCARSQPGSRPRDARCRGFRG